MSRFLLLLLLASAPLLAQTPTSSGQHKAPSSTAEDDKWLAQVSAIRERARHILKAELSRKLHPGCDYSQLYKKLSDAEYTRCAETDEVITEHNYQSFVDAVSAYLSIQDPEEDPAIHPLPSRNFAAAEAAWHTYLDKICAAVGDFHAGGSGVGAEVAESRQRLTRQHMRDLNEMFL